MPRGVTSGGGAADSDDGAKGPRTARGIASRLWESIDSLERDRQIRERHLALSAAVEVLEGDAPIVEFLAEDDREPSAGLAGVAQQLADVARRLVGMTHV